MAKLGNYEIVRRIHHEDPVTVWTARPADAEPDTPARYIIKSCQPFVTMSGQFHHSAEVDHFIDAVRVQSKVCESGARHWAPIHQAREVTGGAFYVSDYYEYSAQRLQEIEGWLNARSLHRLFSSVVAGLLELKKACGRPHGNLKATNIQVAADGDLAHAKVVLTDPLPGAALDPAAAAGDDLRGLGNLVYELIFRRPFRFVSGWPLPESKRWDVLGGKANGWRELCSRLLDPNLDPSALTLEQLAQEVAALRARWTPRVKMAAVAALVVVLGGAGLLYHRHRAGRTQVPKPSTSDRPVVVDDGGWSKDDARAWRELCYAFDDWFAVFHREVSRSKWRRDEWRGDPSLGAIAKMVEEADLKSLDPRAIVGDSEASLAELAEDPPDAARTPEGIAKTKRAHQTVAALAEAITRGPLVGSATVRELAKAFGARGWAKPAQRLNELADSLKPRKWPLAIALDDSLGAARKLRTVEAVHRKLQERIVQDAGEPGGAGARLGAYLEEQTAAAEDLDSLLTALKVVERFADIVAAGAQGMQSIEKSIRDAGGEELAKKFVQCVSARWKDVSTSAARDQMLDGARKAASHLETRLTQMHAHYEAIKELGQQVADDHKALVRTAVRDAQDLDGLLGGIGKAAALAKAIEDKWAAVRAAARPLEESPDPILKAFRSAVVAEIRASRGLESLPEKLAELKTFATRLERVAVDEEIDHARFLKDRTVRPKPDGTITRGILVAWLTEAEGYRRLPPLADPRLPKEAWAAEAKDIRFLIEFLKDFGKPDEVRRGDECTVALQAAEAAIADMQALAWVKKNERLIRARATQNKAALETVRRKVGQPTGAIAQGLNGIRKLNTLGATRALNEQWVKRRDALVPAHVTADQVKAEPRRYGTMWRDVQALRDFLVGLDDLGELPKGPPELAKDVPPSPTSRVILEKLRPKRDQAIAAILASAPWRPDGVPQVGLAELRKSEAYLEARDAYRQWRDDAGRLLVDVHKMLSLLALGDLRDVKFRQARTTVRELHAECVDKPIYKEFADLLRPMADQVAALVPIETLGKDPLVARGTELLKRPKDKLSPEDVHLVWTTLGSKVAGWPATAAELSFDLSLQREIREGAARLAATDAARATALRQEVDRGGPARWEKVFNAAVARVAPNDLADAQVAAVVALLKTANVRPEALDPMARFRVLLHRLRQAAAALPDEGWTDENQEVVAQFERAVRTLPGAFAARPELQPFLGDLRKFLQRKKPTGPTGDLTKAGPAAALLPAAAAACKTSVAPEAKSVSYLLTVRPPGTREETYSLQFVRVSPAEGQPAAYLCTTEVSIALFSGVLAAAGKTKDESEALLQWERMSGARGPRAWRIRRGRVDKNLLWLAELPGVKTYPAGLSVPRPTTLCPMQYVSPEAALYVARVLGCRLPSSTEWQAAYQPGGETNLRDTTSWLKQRDYILNLQRRNKPSWPDTDVFLPKDATAARGGTAQPVAGASDTRLWFSPVGSGGAFQHLAGNVAELVYDAPPRFNEAFKEPGSLSTARLRSFLDEGAAHLKVIGGSALSPPELWNGADKSFAGAWPADLARARRGYSDVGFRLAFTAPGDPLARRLKNLLKRWGYLTKAP